MTGFFRRLRGSESGNVSMIVAFMALPMMVAAGGAVDYAMAISARTKLQTALDSATLTATNRLGNLSDDQIEALARKYFEANVGDLPISTQAFDISIDRNNSVVDISVNAAVATSFLRLVGIDSFPLKVSAQARIGYGGLEIVMVLDNSGSMKTNDRIGKLRNAAKMLVDTLATKATTAGRVKIGLVPFTQFANVGTGNAGASWLAFDDWFSGVSSGIYRFSGKQDYCERGRGCTGARWQGWIKRTASGSTIYESCSDVRTDSSGNYYCSSGAFRHRWTGAVGWRGNDLDIKDELYNLHRIPPVIDRIYGYGGSLFGSDFSLAPIRPLTDIHTSSGRQTIKNAIDAMAARGGTYIPAGLVWGWRVLSNAEPYSEGVTYTEARRRNIRKIIIIMTDGYNTSRKSAEKLPYVTRLLNGTQHQNTADNTLKSLCHRIRTGGPETGNRPYADIISITLDLGDIDPQERNIKQIFSNCATLGWYDIDNANLVSTFGTIARKIGHLRLSR